MDFNDFYSKHEHDLSNKVQLVLVDPFYSILYEPHDKISLQDMKKLCVYAAHILKESGTLVIMCSF